MRQTLLMQFGFKLPGPAGATLEHCPWNHGEHEARHGTNRDEVGNTVAWADYCSFCLIVLRSSSKRQVGRFLKI
jgi:hypothetical protein